MPNMQSAKAIKPHLILLLFPMNRCQHNRCLRTQNTTVAFSPMSGHGKHTRFALKEAPFDPQKSSRTSHTFFKLPSGNIIKVKELNSWEAWLGVAFGRWSTYSHFCSPVVWPERSTPEVQPWPRDRAMLSLEKETTSPGGQDVLLNF